MRASHYQDTAEISREIKAMAVLMQAETEMLSGVVQESTNIFAAAAQVGEGGAAFRPRPALCYKGSPYEWQQMTVQNDSTTPS